MDDFAAFQGGLSHLDTLLSLAQPGPASRDGEATLLPDGRIEIWDTAAAPPLKESVRRVLRALATPAERVWHAGEWAYPFHLSPEAVAWIEATARATGLRLRP